MLVKDTELKDSPVNDSLFMKLISELEECSAMRGDCGKCPLCRGCRRAFDVLAERLGHDKITEFEYQAFKDKFINLSKQMTFC